jgi:hypothetical protein
VLVARQIVLEALRCFGFVALEQVPVGVGHVGRGVTDVVADPLEREAGVVHEADVAVSEFVQAVNTAPARPDPPAEVARLVADEIDYFELVYRDRYGSKVWTIPQARSISELFGDCDSAEDFSRRLAALADLLGKLNPYGN